MGEASVVPANVTKPGPDPKPLRVMPITTITFAVRPGRYRDMAVALNIPVFQAYRGVEPPRFASQAELECARLLDYYGVPWMYEPRPFFLEQDGHGRGTGAFAPDFY